MISPSPRRKYHTLALAVVLSLVATTTCFAWEPPANWHQRVHAQVERTYAFSDEHDKEVRVLTDVLDKHGEVMETKEERYRLRKGEDGERIKEMLGPNGEVTDTEVEDNPTGREGRLLSPFDTTQADRYEYDSVLAEPDGRLKITYHPVDDDDDDAFQGVAWVDTTTWAVTRLEGQPGDRPMGVKELRMTIDYAPNDEGVWIPDKIQTFGHIKMLFITGRFRSDQTITFLDRD